jgi:uncharacterized protein YjbJ (UPF0337 family)
MNKDRIVGAAKQAAGKTKFKLGRIVGDAKLQIDGKAEQADGKIQNAEGSVKDSLKQ